MKKDNKEQRTISEIQPPNKFIQPFSYQQWKLADKLVKEREKNIKLNRHLNSLSVFMYSFGKSFLGIFGLLLLIIFVILAFTIPYTTQNPIKTDISNKYVQIFSDGNILGTDNLGRDVWARLWHGMRFSFQLAFMATMIDVCIGVLVGILMGQYKKFDIVMQWVIKVMSNIPVIIVMILATLAFKPSFWILVLSMTITGWISMANQIRSQILRAKTFLWVTASKVLGTKPYKIITNFIPVIIPILITQLVFTIPGAILAETSLAVIGLSIPGEPTLGNMIADGAKIITLYSRFALIPSFMLVIVITSIQFIGNATQDALRRQR